MAYDPKATVWHLVCETYRGKISMLKNLDEHTARETYKRLRPDEYPVRYLRDPEPDHDPTHFGRMWSGNTTMRTFGPGEDWLQTVHVIGPEGVNLDPWCGVEPHVIDQRTAA